MLRALLWKEWRQLALVRWGGIALGAVLPIAFTAGAELAQRGLLPTAKVAGYAPRDLMFELLPAALALGVWPLIALMSAAQAFAGDRAAGTESFLLERPVPLAAVWRARLLASFGTLLVVIVATAMIAAAAAAWTGPPPVIGWSRWALLSALGVGVGLLAFLGGVIAASLLASPLGAVLLGAVLGAVPVVLAAELTSFMYARLGNVFLGAVLPVLMLPAFVLASWLAFCRGEPAGRGRIRRIVTVMSASLAGVLVLFAVLAPVIVRANATMGHHAISSAPSGKTAFVGSTSGEGWLVDVASGSKRVFVPPPVRGVAWSPDGTEVAMQTWSGPLGSVRPHERLEIRSTADGRVLRTIPIPDEIIVYSMAWADAGLVTVVSRESSRKARQAEVEIIDPITGALRPTGFSSDAGWSMRLTEPTGDRRVLVRVMEESKPSDGPETLRGYRLHPVDVATSQVGAAVADASGRSVVFSGWTGGLSPSGRFARIVDNRGDPGGARVIDLRAGVDQPVAPASPSASWIQGDRLVWHEDLDHRTRLFVETPGAPPKPLREWRDAQVGIQPSPDGRAVFVSVIPDIRGPGVDTSRRPPDPALFEGTAPTGGIAEELVYVPEEDRFITLGPPFSGRANDMRWSEWAGPKTLARIAPGVVYFEDIDKPGVRRFVIGGPGDLE
jgi:hypothetical protein